MFRLLKFLVLIAILGGVGVVGFAYLGDLSPDVREVSEPVSFDAR